MFSSNLEGNWILINYWADWCPPCIKEIPEINTFSDKHPEVIVLAFNFDRLEAEDLRPQIKKFNIKYPSLIILEVCGELPHQKLYQRLILFRLMER